jgi:hypothetical protein
MEIYAQCTPRKLNRQVFSHIYSAINGIFDRKVLKTRLFRRKYEQLEEDLKPWQT